MRILSISLLAVALAGCSVVQTETVRFHDLPKSVSGRTFAVVPLADAQAASLEFRSYKGAIESRMRSIGFAPVEDESRAEFLVFINYSVGQGRTVTSSTPIYGRTGGGTSYLSGSVIGRGGPSSYRGTAYTPPTYGVIGSSVSTTTLYARVFTLDIVEKKSSTRVFEGRVKSVGRSSNFATVSRCLFDAMFEGFPGPSGETKKSEIDSQTCVK